jgi:hypothetical protein
MKFSMEPIDHDAPVRRDEPDLTVNLAVCNTSTLLAVVSDLRDHPSARDAIEQIEQRVADRRQRRHEAEIRAYERRQAEKQAAAAK